MLSGNVNQLGDFDLCLAVRSPERDIKGKYCLSYVQVDVPIDSTYLEVLHDMVHAHSPFRSQLNDVSKIKNNMAYDFVRVQIDFY